MSVYDDVVKVMSDYLGPAAERYVIRQTKFHLEKPPEELTKEDVEKMTEWVRSSLGLLTEDKKMVDECVERLSKLAA